jgi:hypothetical protein
MYTRFGHLQQIMPLKGKIINNQKKFKTIWLQAIETKSTKPLCDDNKIN